MFIIQIKLRCVHSPGQIEYQISLMKLDKNHVNHDPDGLFVPLDGCEGEGLGTSVASPTAMGGEVWVGRTERTRESWREHYLEAAE